MKHFVLNDVSPDKVPAWVVFSILVYSKREFPLLSGRDNCRIKIRRICGAVFPDKNFDTYGTKKSTHMKQTFFIPQNTDGILK
ncbi:MAG TPA: hypothetical protein PLI57_08370 [Spirochaetota bacterium]|nr:hypothetical protein [Spirochaetota bacterium]